jgi:hypothetical protein
MAVKTKAVASETERSDLGNDDAGYDMGNLLRGQRAGEKRDRDPEGTGSGGGKAARVIDRSIGGVMSRVCQGHWYQDRSNLEGWEEDDEEPAKSPFAAWIEPGRRQAGRGRPNREASNSTQLTGDPKLRAVEAKHGSGRHKVDLGPAFLALAMVEVYQPPTGTPGAESLRSTFDRLMAQHRGSTMTKYRAIRARVFRDFVEAIAQQARLDDSNNFEGLAVSLKPDLMLSAASGSRLCTVDMFASLEETELDCAAFRGIKGLLEEVQDHMLVLGSDTMLPDRASASRAFRKWVRFFCAILIVVGTESGGKPLSFASACRSLRDQESHREMLGELEEVVKEAPIVRLLSGLKGGGKKWT